MKVDLISSSQVNSHALNGKEWGRVLQVNRRTSTTAAGEVGHRSITGRVLCRFLVLNRCTMRLSHKIPLEK